MRARGVPTSARARSTGPAAIYMYTAVIHDRHPVACLTLEELMCASTTIAPIRDFQRTRIVLTVSTRPNKWAARLREDFGIEALPPSEPSFHGAYKVYTTKILVDRRVYLYIPVHV
eukprot:SAG22_NODE_4966_length_1121_cov_0.943249_1_plen_115_part_10